MRQYELMMILDPSLKKAEIDELLADIKNDLSETSINVKKEDIWGAKDMAYAINGSDTGYYAIYQVESEDPRKLKSITSSFNIKKGLWRYMFTAVES